MHRILIHEINFTVLLHFRCEEPAEYRILKIEYAGEEQEILVAVAEAIWIWYLGDSKKIVQSGLLVVENIFLYKRGGLANKQS